MENNKYKGWNVFEVLPKGWKIDNHTGSPLFGYDFCTDGKSILNGGQRALVRSIRKGTPRIEFVKPIKQTPIVTKTEENDDFVFPSKTVNTLARLRFQKQLLKEIQFDLMVCEIEGWDKKEYINELKKLINSIGIKNKTKHKQIDPSLFDSNPT